MGFVLERLLPDFDQLCPNTEFLEESQSLEWHRLCDGFKNFYLCNPLSSVVDLEEEDIKVNRFAFVDYH